MIFASEKHSDFGKALKNKDDAREKIFVVPTNRKARRLKKEFISEGLNEFHVETLGTLTSAILSEIENFRPLDDASVSYLLNKATLEITPRYFTRYRNETFPKGTLEKIRSVISEYKRNGITPEILIDEASAAQLETSEINKANDIAEIYKNFLELSAKLNALEPGDVYIKLLDLSREDFRNAFEKIYPKTKTIFLRHFTELTPIEVQLLKRFAETGISVFVEIDYSNQNKYLFEHLGKTVERLEKAGFYRFEKNLIEKNSLAKHLTNALFKFSADEPKKFDNVFIFSGKNKYEEAENIAKLIKDLIDRENVPPHKIAVAFNLIGDYSAIVRTVFEEYGLPFNLSDRLTADKAPSVNAALSFLEIKKNNFYYKTLFSAINNNYSGSVVADAYNLQRFSQNHGILYGLEKWREKVEKVNSDERATDADKARAKQALEDIEKIAALLKPFDKKLLPSAFLNELKKLIVVLKIPDTLLKINSDKAEANIAALSVFLEGVATVLDLITDEENGEREHDFNFYFEKIKTVASWARFNVKERSDAGVLVTSAEELRGLKFDYVFFGGLNDGSLPLKFKPEIFFTKNFAVKESEKLAEQRFIFYNVFNSFEKNIYLSYALTSDKSELSLSVFLNDFKRCVVPVELNEEYFSAKLYSEREKQIHFSDLAEEDYFENPNEIKRKRKSYYERKENKAGIYNGHLLEINDETISRYFERFSQRTFSVSQFENYAACPFKYFSERILKLEVLDEPEKEIEPILVGNFLHEVLFLFYNSLYEKKLTVQDTEAEKLLFEIAEKLYDKYGFDDEIYFYEKEKFFGIRGNKYDSILYHFIEKEREQTEYVPKYFEVAFGKTLSDEEKTDKNLGSETPVEIEGIKLAGKIDRIDLAAEKVAVIDYKSGNKKVTANSILRGEDLQLPIYLRVALELLGEHFAPGRLAIYTLKFNSQDFGLSQVKLSKKKEPEEALFELIDAAVDFVKEYHSAMTRGIFSPTENEKREDGVCKYCDFRSLCRIDEREEITEVES